MRLNREVKRLIKAALQEDIGREDVTTLFSIPYHFKTEGVILAKEKGVLCGLDIVRAVFKERHRSVIFKAYKQDGDTFRKNQRIVYLKGDARVILAAERVALNFLSLFSGIATITRRFVHQVRGTHAVILDTRKTTPTLRNLEKYAVRIGGGRNHRKSLGEAILIKDNHLRAGRFIRHGVFDEKRMAKFISYVRTIPSMRIEIEVENLEHFRRVIKYKPDIIMLDNFIPRAMRKAVIFRNKKFPKVKLEASGGVGLDNVRRIASTGVDFISIGSITHSSKAIDFSLEIIDK
ncbi:MAG: carboxylating nicotinate-nucleotide diphosphorylase [Candidatus Omnitrophota bacterium]